jgi:hypothetical protein
MKVVAYSVREFEKEFVARANHKQHDITLISNTLNLETALYAQGKEAVVVGGRRRMRGGTGGEGVGVGFRGEIGGTRWPIAERSPAPTTTHV